MATLRSTYSYILDVLKDPRAAWLAVLLCGGVLYNLVTYTSRSAEKQVTQRYEQWWGYLHRGQYERAYRLMSPEYRAEHTVDEFYRQFILAGEDWLRPHSGRRVESFQRRATIFPRDSFSDGNGGPEYELLQVGGQWYFTGEFQYIYGSRTHMFAGD